MFLPRVASRLEASKNNRVPSFSYSRRIKTTQKGVDFVVFVFFIKIKIKMTGMKWLAVTTAASSCPRDDKKKRCQISESQKKIKKRNVQLHHCVITFASHSRIPSDPYQFLISSYQLHFVSTESRISLHSQNWINISLGPSFLPSFLFFFRTFLWTTNHFLISPSQLNPPSILIITTLYTSRISPIQ